MKSNAKNFKQLSEDDKNKIVKLFYDGKSKMEIIKEMNITRRTYPLVFEEKGINTKRKNKYSLNENYFNKINTRTKAYILGYIAADGCITNKNYFAIASTDKDILELIKKELKYTGDIYIPKRVEHSTWNTAYRLNFSSKQICNDLKKIGIYPNKSLVFNDFPKINKKYIPDFIRGYFDGDGTLYNSICTSNYTHHYIRWTFNIIATEKMCEVLNNYFIATINEKGYIVNSKTPEMKYLKYDSKRALTKIYKLLYNNTTCYMNRKFLKWKDFLGSLEEKSSKEKQGEPIK